jgi:glycosyltransferase involved in cell wall biosynthesis
MKTSLIVIVYNRAAWLKVCLGALLHQSVRPDEVVVADDGSQPAEVDAVKAFLAAYPIPSQYAFQEDRGFRAAAARNMGIRRASGDYLVMLDCDIVLMPDAMAQHLDRARPGRFLQGRAALLDEAATRPVLERGLLTSADLDPLWRAADRSPLAAAEWRFQKNRLLRALHMTKRHKPQLVSNHFSLFREDIEKVNGFDERYEGWGLEDDDLGQRLYQAGLDVRSVSRHARAVHLWHATNKPDATEWASRNTAYFHRDPVATCCEKGLKRAAAGA